MEQRRVSEVSRGLETRLSRRATIRGAGALGLAGALTVHRPGLLVAQEATPAVASYPEVIITATDYAFDMPATIDGGWTLLTIDNQGSMTHHAFFLRPTGEATVEEIQAALETPDFAAILEISSSIGGPPSVDPGSRASVAINLAPGMYVVVCAIPDENGTPHYMLGQQAVVEVTARAGNALPAFADTKVTLVEYAFDGLPAEVPAGMATWEVFNDGEQLHEMAVARLQPGVTVDMLFGGPPDASPSADTASPAASPMASPAAGGPPFTSVGGSAPLSPGNTVWAVFDFEPGDYFAISFVPDFATGVPDFASGMIASFTVT